MEVIFCLISVWTLVADSVTIDCVYARRRILRSHVAEEYKVLLPRDYYCEATISKKCNATNLVAGVLNKHLKGKSSVHLKYLRAQNQNIPQLPMNMEKFFPNLMSLVVRSGLQQISKNVLKYPKLKHLGLSKNKLRTLDGDLFEFVPKLKTLFLSFNPILHMGLNILDSLGQLETVAFHKLKCKSFGAIHNFEENSAQKIEKLKQQLEQKCPPQEEEEKSSNEINIGGNEEDSEDQTQNQPEGSVVCDISKCKFKCKCKYGYDYVYPSSQSNGSENKIRNKI